MELPCHVSPSRSVSRHEAYTARRRDSFFHHTPMPPVHEVPPQIQRHHAAGRGMTSGSTGAPPRKYSGLCRQRAGGLRGSSASFFIIWLGLAVLLVVSGCGYSLETPRLPGNAGTLAIGTIRNRTFTGELDVRLQHRLRSLLLKHPGFELSVPERSDLILDIELTEFRAVRARDLATTSLTSVSYQLIGLVSVYDRRHSRYHIRRQPVNSVSRLDFDTPTVETPAIRDEGLEDALQSFSVQVENLLFLTF
jgi:hypothetical protein